ncbi:hypothetical protein PCANC_27091 [Puccinia coronata f. sp. avenae]|uniref:Uncharacterized protein n=1 Tax=Puccinia coronata f. sp. avenae TaxID=200324 RepID=A0A2N5THD1_9BASI|nr:hypothetical protein PCANC_27091 [Puccinia coronata f. sp. avenae]
MIPGRSEERSQRWLGLMRDFQAGQKKLAVQSLIIRGCVLVLGANEPSSLTPYLSSAINDPQRISYTSLSNIVTSLVPVDTAVTRIPLLSIAATAAGPLLLKAVDVESGSPFSLGFATDDTSCSLQTPDREGASNVITGSRSKQLKKAGVLQTSWDNDPIPSSNQLENYSGFRLIGER